MTDATWKRVIDNGWPLQKETYNSLSRYEKSFVEIEFARNQSVDFYETRLKKIDFVKKGRVVDVGCGMGQWSTALAKLNLGVIAFEVNQSRIDIAMELRDSMQLPNLNFQIAKAEKLPLEDESVDAIFCYGVLMFTDLQESLVEFSRVLKPLGVVYLNIDSSGYYLRLFLVSIMIKRDVLMAITALRCLLNGVLKKNKDAAFSPTRMRKVLQNLGWEIIGVGAEGSLGNTEIYRGTHEKYPKSFFGLPVVTEALVRKKLKT